MKHLASHHRSKSGSTQQRKKINIMMAQFSAPEAIAGSDKNKIIQQPLLAPSTFHLLLAPHYNKLAYQLHQIYIYTKIRSGVNRNAAGSMGEGLPIVPMYSV